MLLATDVNVLGESLLTWNGVKGIVGNGAV